MSGVRGMWRLAGVWLLAVAVSAASFGSPGEVALAQDGPRFSEWGPGLSPPEEEGVDGTPSPQPSPRGRGDSASGVDGGPSESAAPYGPPNAVAPAPGPGRSACRYDLRGTWSNQGRQTSGYRHSYSATVYVRQYRSYIYAQQDDGTSYYGRCLGSRLQFDVYGWSDFVGHQDGSISGDWRTTDRNPRYGEPSGYEAPSPYEAPAAAAAPPPPDRGAATRATFTWSTWYGSGRETWTK